MPLPSTRVVPAGWSRHHQPVASGGMNASCTVTDPARATPGVWDDTRGEYTPGVPFVVLTGRACRVQALRSGEDTEQGGQQSAGRQYLVQLDDPGLAEAAVVDVGHVVTIDAAVNDSRLVGESMTVVDVQLGSERFTRDLVCDHNQQPPGVEP